MNLYWRIGITVAATVTAYGWLKSHDARVRAAVHSEYKSASDQLKAQHQKVLADAEKQHSADMAALVDYQRANPIVMRVRIPAASSGTVAAPCANTGPATADIQPVPAGNTEPTRDIGPMLSALAASADAVAADLREQQAVP